MSDTERDKLFGDAKVSRQTEKMKEAEKKNYSDYEEVQFGALRMNALSSFRILGNPASNRMGDETSPKNVVMSMITGDDDKKFRCIWPDAPNGDVGKNWILGKIFNKVMAYKWDSEANERSYFALKKFGFEDINSFRDPKRGYIYLLKLKKLTL